MSLVFEQRKMFIMNHLEEFGHLQVRDIRKQLGVSAMTVQRDLVKLEAEGLIIRGFGEVLKTKGGGELHYMTQEDEGEGATPQSHQIIAGLAKGYVKEGDSVYFGDGKLVAEYAKTVADTEMVALCGSIRSALRLVRGNADVYLTGGHLKKKDHTLTGGFAEETIKNCFLDKAVITCAALNVHGELCDYTEEMSCVNKLVLQHAKHVVLLIEESRMGKNKMFRSGSLDQIEMLVTDQEPEKYFIKKCEDSDTHLLYPGCVSLPKKMAKQGLPP